MSKKNNESGNPDVPNNWISPKGGSAWKYSETRNEFYYAPNTMPHLNFRNPQVVDEFGDIMKQWIDAGADGFQLKGAPYLLVDDKFRDAPFSSEPGYVHTEYLFYNHKYTVNVEGLGNVLAQWKNVVKNYNDNQGA